MTKFTEVLNDTIDYFLLGDVELLLYYKEKNNLSNDLATEFTTNDSGDEIVKNGILLPMSKIVNQPYTIIFKTTKNKSEFEKSENELIFKKSGYILKVENRKVVLFTWWFLNDFSDEKVRELMKTPNKWNKPFYEIKNGWYDIDIFGGFTKQESKYKDVNGNIISDSSLEPTLEFSFIRRVRKGDFKANVNESFELING
ncbi:hypothetical protein [Croceivirga sp. JEA036]|uniref:hypothetical protein n=1 Tax=Croceivirga sp. JEA036 TaxID=2721162 RepID=UPI00143A2C9A|nr:hypothetical protein [Croceivirga sp. JEA036]NJB35795.1 hypothetical protein [Croceivirga sp. JEA036]